MTKPGSDNNLLRGIGLLLTCTAIVVVLLGMLQQRTREPIEANAAAHALRLIQEVLPGVTYDNTPATDTVWLTDAALGAPNALPTYRARAGETVVAVALTVVAPDGYVGPISLLVGMDARGKLLAVRVTQHRETPGLGDRIEADKSDWINRFSGRDLSGMDSSGMNKNSPLNLRSDAGDLDAITGATVTSRAVVDAVRKARDYYLQNQAWIHSQPTAESDD